MHAAIKMFLVCLTAVLLAACGEDSTSNGPRFEIVDEFEGESEGDRRVLEHMRKAGADLSKETDVRWYVYLPERASAETFAEKARAGGWTVAVREGADGTSWLALCSRAAVPAAETIRNMRKSLSAWGEGLEADVDGWEAAIQK